MKEIKPTRFIKTITTMRIISFILTMMVACGAFAQAKAKYDCEDYNFGTIKENGGPVSHTFIIENVGNRPMVIRGIYISCGCTTSTHTKEAIMPGEKGQITVTLDPKDLEGNYIKTIFVHTNTKQRKKEIFIRANIEKEKAADEKQQSQ